MGSGLGCLGKPGYHPQSPLHPRMCPLPFQTCPCERRQHGKPFGEIPGPVNPRGLRHSVVGFGGGGSGHQIFPYKRPLLGGSESFSTLGPNPHQPLLPEYLGINSVSILFPQTISSLFTFRVKPPHPPPRLLL